jgi:hypothetical protein
VIDVQTGQTLLECGLDESEKAHHFAAELDLMGLEVKIINPTLSETLSHSLGLSHVQQKEYLDSLDEEMENHEGSCCIKKD